MTSKTLCSEQRRLRPPVSQQFNLQSLRSRAAAAGWRLPHLSVEPSVTGLPATTEVLSAPGLTEVESIWIRSDVAPVYVPAFKQCFEQLNGNAQSRLRTLSLRYCKGTASEILDSAFDARPLAMVTTLTVAECELDDVAMVNLAGHLAASLFPRITTLSFLHNRIGDHGLRALAQAMEAGALSQLQTLLLRTNRIGDAGICALAAALSSGVGMRLETLKLDGNRWGDHGALAFTDALHRDALPRCTNFGIALNRIGDRGVESLIDALCRQKLPACRYTWVRGNQARPEVQERFLSIVQQRRDDDARAEARREASRRASR